jgi:hypothetical protein
MYEYGYVSHIEQPSTRRPSAPAKVTATGHQVLARFIDIRYYR